MHIFLKVVRSSQKNSYLCLHSNAEIILTFSKWRDSNWKYTDMIREYKNWVWEYLRVWLVRAIISSLFVYWAFSLTVIAPDHLLVPFIKWFYDYPTVNVGNSNSLMENTIHFLLVSSQIHSRVNLNKNILIRKCSNWLYEMLVKQIKESMNPLRVNQMLTEEESPR